MRKIILLVILIGFLTVSHLNAQLILTGAFDGPLSGGTPKGVEIFVYEDVADLSIFGLGSANNGGGTDGEEFTFPADAATAGDFIYVATESIQFNAFFGFDPNYTSTAMSINGDDAIELFKNGLVFDIFGDINVDGSGEPWDHLDGWAYRVDDTGPDDSTFILANWNFSGVDGLEGGVTNATCTVPFPIGTFTSTIPVELTSFSAIVNENQIKLVWNTATELNNFGFEIQRSIDKEAWSNIGFVNGSGTSTSSNDYTFLDDNISNAVAYSYRLKQVDHDGSFEFSKTIEVVIGAPADYKLDQNFPNPFNPSTLISFTLPEEGMTRLTIFNSLGQEVKNLVNENLEAGYHQFNFNAVNLTSGVYYYKLESGDFVKINKMMLLK
jgi:hypothetical protein